MGILELELFEGEIFIGKMKYTIATLILFMALSINVKESKAACCNYEYGFCAQIRAGGKQYFSNGKLYSSSYTAYCAGGSGGCNIFCCNCDKGCDYGKFGEKKRSAMQEN